MRISDWSSYVCSSDLFGQIRDFGCRQDGLAARDHGIERRPGQIEWRRCGGVNRATQQQGKQDEVETQTHGSTFVFQTDASRTSGANEANFSTASMNVRRRSSASARGALRSTARRGGKEVVRTA